MLSEVPRSVAWRRWYICYYLWICLFDLSGRGAPRLLLPVDPKSMQRREIVKRRPRQIGWMRFGQTGWLLLSCSCFFCHLCPSCQDFFVQGHEPLVETTLTSLTVRDNEMILVDINEWQRITRHQTRWKRQAAVSCDSFPPNLASEA